MAAGGIMGHCEGIKGCSEHHETQGAVGHHEIQCAGAGPTPCLDVVAMVSV